jgi:hypothetical protein
VWKPLVFFGIAVTAAGLGFAWHAIADPNRAQAVPTPMSFAVFETNSDVPLYVDGHLLPGSCCALGKFDKFTLTVRPGSVAPNSVVLISNQRIQYSSSNGESILPGVKETTSGTASGILYYLVFHPTSSTNMLSAQFRTPETVRIDGVHGNIAAALPRISGGEPSDTPSDRPSDLAVQTGYRLVQGVVYEDFPHDGPDTSVETIYSPKSPGELLRMPKSLAITERLILGAEGLDRGDIKQDLPTTGGVEGSDFVWRSDTGISPTLIAVGRAAEQDYASDEFRSGVAFAISAAALIALLQEGPARISGLRGRDSRTAPTADVPAGAEPSETFVVSRLAAAEEGRPADVVTPSSAPAACSGQHHDIEQADLADDDHPATADSGTTGPDRSDATRSERGQSTHSDDEGQLPPA